MERGLRSKRFHSLGSLVWAILLESWLKLLVFGLRVYLDAYCCYDPES